MKISLSEFMEIINDLPPAEEAYRISKMLNTAPTECIIYKELPTKRQPAAIPSLERLRATQLTFVAKVTVDGVKWHSQDEITIHN